MLMYDCNRTFRMDKAEQLLGVVSSLGLLVELKCTFLN